MLESILAYPASVNLKPFISLLCAVFAWAGTVLAQDQTVYDDALQNGWQSYGWATLNFSNTSPVHNGPHSISVVDPTTSYQALYLHHSAFDPSLYQSLSFWIYPTKAGTNELNLEATLSGNAQAAIHLSFTAQQINKWQQVTQSLASLGVAGNPGFDGFWIQNNTGASNTFYVDDITLVAAPLPPQLLLNVNPQAVIRTIDDRIYGLNLAIWDSALSGATSASLLTNMNTRIVRFPGGSSSDDYDWQTGKSVSSGTSWVNNAATFAKVTAARGAQAFVTVNYGNGTPEQAAAWVAYYNASPTSNVAIGVDSKGRDWKTAGYWASLRAAAPLGQNDGSNFLRLTHPAAYALKYWEIGNECYGDWENDQHGVTGSGLTGAQHDPYTYAQAFQNYYHKMIAVDPTIHIGAVANPREDSYGIGTHAVANPNEGNSLHTGWSAVMLATLKAEGTLPHFLIHHFYAQNPGNETDAGLLQSGADLQSDAANLRKMITDYAGAAQGAAIELNVTEMNSVSSNPGKQSVSLVNALFMADAMGNLAQTEFNACTWWDFRNGGGGGNNDAALYGWRMFGDYGVVASGDRGDTPVNTPYPNYYAAKLLTNWGHGGDRLVSTTSNYPLLSAYTAKLANGNLAVLVVNKHPANDLTAQISLGSFTPGSGTGTLYSYGKPNDLANADLTQSTFNPSSGTFSYTFLSYSASVLIVKSQYQAWRESQFTSSELNDPTVSGDNAEPAGDGLSNLTKYAMGLPPHTSSAAGGPLLGFQSLSGKSYLSLTFTRQITLSDIQYVVEVSSDLQNWQSGSSFTLRTDDGTTSRATYRDLTAIQDAPHRFIRLKIVRF